MAKAQTEQQTEEAQQVDPGVSGNEAPQEQQIEEAHEADEGVVDKNGNPGINRDKYQRDIAARDKRIEELEAQLAEKTKSEEGREEVMKELAQIKADFEEQKTDMKLEAMGCKAPKAAKAMVEDYDGDFEKLKDENPWLFDGKNKQEGSTGGNPSGGGGSGKEAELVQKAREAAGTARYYK